MKKKIIISIIVFIVVILGIIACCVISDLNQEGKIENELMEISNLIDPENMDLEAINARLDITVSKGDYAVVEKAFKNYLRDNFNNITKISEILNDDKITSLLTVENYKNDGKEFTETKKYITETRETLENCKTTYIELLTEEKAMSYINDKEVDSYYINFYKQQLVGDLESQEDSSVVDSIDELIKILDTSEEVIDFLVKNKDNWDIEDDNIVFSSEKLSNEYDKLIDTL